ncbi:putative 28S rRNA (cytosine-C(5))-methyltransferase [Dorcoceras hygrometricum]|uniref:Putative 28S rRNA (Cytosine-C(5))-methyltransferase n=1 Tax=Dorcoceras hygrometricum TaxID=472368 RepID=A0A2Z7D516_9LAMI|nr:putative 28S rRNA (cytosine-C(5))-methyltransferase [Dorcoceras hygrometricum]
MSHKRPTNAERSAYFARREAAKVLRSTLQGDAKQRAVGSIKSLVYSPSIRNKKATFALVCETLKHLSVIKNVLEDANILGAKWKEGTLIGDAERYVMLKKDALQLALSRILSRNGAKEVKDLVVLDKISDLQKQRFARVNTLKMDTESVIGELRKQYEVKKDDMVPDLLILQPRTDLHNHPLVFSGCVFLQGKGSSMVAVALAPEPGWEVIDACAAPGNKTLHLAALMKGKGKIIACERDRERVKRLKENVTLAGALNVKVEHEDFLNLDPSDPTFSKIRAILLDPSCSGSGTVVDRLDHLLPSHRAGQSADEMKRLRKLAGFQKRVLEHALSFPAVERIVYSTCSIHQIENEDVINSVLHLASSRGFQLETVFPQYPRRGLPTFDGSEHLLRTDLVEDKEGFFIALFVRKNIRHLKDEVRVLRKEVKVASKSRKPFNVFVAKMLKVPFKPRKNI